MQIEHPDITHARLTGYPHGRDLPRVTVWKAKEVQHEDAFPYRYDEREDV